MGLPQQPSFMARVQTFASESMRTVSQNLHIEDPAKAHRDEPSQTCELELEVTWKALQINSSVAKACRPGNGANSYLDVSLYMAHDVQHPVAADAEKTLYWATVECLPRIEENNILITDKADGPKTLPKTKSIPIKPDNTKVEMVGFGPKTERDKKEEIERKISNLIHNVPNIPLDLIEDLLGVPVKEIEKFLMNAAASPTQSADVQWEKGFGFLLDNPRAATVEIIVYKNKKKKPDEKEKQKLVLTDKAGNKRTMVDGLWVLKKPKGEKHPKTAAEKVKEFLHIGKHNSDDIAADAAAAGDDDEDTPAQMQQGLEESADPATAVAAPSALPCRKPVAPRGVEPMPVVHGMPAVVTPAAIAAHPEALADTASTVSAEPKHPLQTAFGKVQEWFKKDNHSSPQKHSEPASSHR